MFFWSKLENSYKYIYIYIEREREKRGPLSVSVATRDNIYMSDVQTPDFSLLHTLKSV